MPKKKDIYYVCLKVEKMFNLRNNTKSASKNDLINVKVQYTKIVFSG